METILSPKRRLLKEPHGLTSYKAVFFKEQGVEENIWTKEGWSDGRVEKAA
jgi:hypothetical protein